MSDNTSTTSSDGSSYVNDFPITSRNFCWTCDTPLTDENRHPVFLNKCRDCGGPTEPSNSDSGSTTPECRLCGHPLPDDRNYEYFCNGCAEALGLGWLEERHNISSEVYTTTSSSSSSDSDDSGSCGSDSLDDGDDDDDDGNTGTGVVQDANIGDSGYYSMDDDDDDDDDYVGDDEGDDLAKKRELIPPEQVSPPRKSVRLMQKALLKTNPSSEKSTNTKVARKKANLVKQATPREQGVSRRRSPRLKERALRKQSPPPEQKSTNAKVARKKANLAKDSGYATHPEKDILQRQSACLKQNSPQRLSIAPKKSTNNKVTRKKANLAKGSVPPKKRTTPAGRPATACDECRWRKRRCTYGEWAVDSATVTPSSPGSHKRKRVDDDADNGSAAGPSRKIPKVNVSQEKPLLATSTAPVKPRPRYQIGDLCNLQ